MSDRTNTPNVADCECPRCRGPVAVVRAACPDEIVQGGIVCQKCEARYDLIWGAPFLGAYEDADIIGLVEIAANARSDNLYPDAAEIRRLEGLLRAYHEAPDRAAFVKDSSDEFVHAPWFSNRYHEWLCFTELAKDISFSGIEVLDVGAGTGVDSYRLVAAGAKVTAIEYNPMLVRRGMGSLPEARWIGGLSHVLPFASASFDVVCCNAALHHMRDVSWSLEEMLRVLKPGGWLITTGDPYRSRASAQEMEYEVFNQHPAVLLGVNESIPSFSAFETVLARYETNLEISFLTTNLTGVYQPPSLHQKILNWLRFRRDRAVASAMPEMRRWNFSEHRQMLGNANGSLGMCCRLKKPLSINSRRLERTVLSAGDYATTLTDYSRAIQRLATLLPDHHVDRPFPGAKQDKFELLNGWQKPDGSDARTAFRRARWFLRRPDEMDALTFDVKRRVAVADELSRIEVFINGYKACFSRIGTDWVSLVVPLNNVSFGSVFVCELQLTKPAKGVSPSFEDEVFLVRGRCYGTQAGLSNTSGNVN